MNVKLIATHWGNYMEKQQPMLRRNLGNYPFFEGDMVRDIHTKEKGRVEYIEYIRYDKDLKQHIWYLEVSFGGFLRCSHRTTRYVKDTHAQP